MAEQNGTKQPKGIMGITVSGFKSLREESHIEVRPLTILAGANSSGKSSIMQPLLLLKQTLEASYNPGTLKLDGPNVEFTQVEQFLSKVVTGRTPKNFSVSVELYNRRILKNTYQINVSENQITVGETSYSTPDSHIAVTSSTQSAEIVKQLPKSERPDAYQNLLRNGSYEEVEWRVIRRRCFLEIAAFFPDGANTLDLNAIFLNFPIREYIEEVSKVIHVPGLRNNSKRVYLAPPFTESRFQGTFDNYTAGVINDWRGASQKKFDELNNVLRQLDLTSHVSVVWIDYANVELRVGRTRQSEVDDTVSIADVGFGVSQVLPVLVALQVAEPGQLVYIEQPELHLHPRAQVVLAQVLADAANRGVRVVAETHSSLLIQGIQTLVAEEKLDPKDVILHWFTRNEDGSTKITPNELDQYGAYGDWPEDFAEVQMKAGNAYLDAVERRRLEESHDGQKSEMSGD